MVWYNDDGDGDGGGDGDGDGDDDDDDEGSMVWHGMLWYDDGGDDDDDDDEDEDGMVWYGMIWYDMVWYGMVWLYGSMVLWGNMSVLYVSWPPLVLNPPLVCNKNQSSALPPGFMYLRLLLIYVWFATWSIVEKWTLLGNP